MISITPVYFESKNCEKDITQILELLQKFLSIVLCISGIPTLKPITAKISIDNF